MAKPEVAIFTDNIMFQDHILNLYWINDSSQIREHFAHSITQLSKEYISQYEKLNKAIYLLLGWDAAFKVQMKRSGTENLDFPRRGFNNSFLQYIIGLHPQTPYEAAPHVRFDEGEQGRHSGFL